MPVDPTAQFTGLARHVPDAPRKRVAQLLQAFFEKRSALTIRNYRVDLVHFGRWWRAGGHDLDARGSKRGQVRLDLDAIHVAENDDARDEFVAAVLHQFHALEQLPALGVALAYQNDLGSGALGRVFAPQTINHRIAALRAVTNMARLLGMCSFDLDQVETLEINRTRSTEGCGEDGVARLVEQADRDVEAAVDQDERFRASRNAVILHLMHGSGLRRFEPLQLLWPDDVDLAGKRIRFRGKKRRAKEWFQCLSKGGIAAIRTHLAERGTQVGYLLHSGTPKRPLDVKTVNRVIDSLAQRAEVRVTPHGLRHTAATTLLERSNGNVRAVASFLRHKGLGTVQEYDDARQQLPQKMSDLLDRSDAKRKTKKPRPV